MDGLLIEPRQNTLLRLRSAKRGIVRKQRQATSGRLLAHLEGGRSERVLVREHARHERDLSQKTPLALSVLDRGGRRTRTAAGECAADRAGGALELPQLLGVGDVEDVEGSLVRSAGQQVALTAEGEGEDGGAVPTATQLADTSAVAGVPDAYDSTLEDMSVLLCQQRQSREQKLT